MRTTALTAICFLISISLYSQIENFKGVHFERADSIARLYPKHSLKDLKGLSGKLTAGLPTEEEKFRAIYTWVCLNIDNDYSLFQKNQFKRSKLSKDPEALKKWNSQFGKTVMATLLAEYRTVCTGYAYLLRELCVFAGLSCHMVDGYGRTAQANIGGKGIVNHTWNVVNINKQWYLCDATWSSGAIDTQKGRFVKKFDDSYFLLDPALFIRNHYPLDTTWMLLDTPPTLETFLNGPLIYSNLFKYGITQLLPESFHITIAKGSPVQFQFSGEAEMAMSKMEVQVVRGSEKIYSFYPSHSDKNRNGYSFNHTFTHKGMYIVHVLLNDAYVITYSVKVT